MFGALFNLLRKIGIPTCAALLVTACIVGAVIAEQRYALKSDLNLIRETQLAQNIRELHLYWCSSSGETKNYWWAELQKYQLIYRGVSSSNSPYQTAPCTNDS